MIWAQLQNLSLAKIHPIKGAFQGFKNTHFSQILQKIEENLDFRSLFYTDSILENTQVAHIEQHTQNLIFRK